MSGEVRCLLCLPQDRPWQYQAGESGDVHRVMVMELGGENKTRGKE